MDRYVIPNLRNACRILEALSERKQGSPLQALSSELGIPRTTAFRILKTLQIEGYVREEEHKYYIGAKLITLGQSASEGLEIRRIADPLLRELTAKIDESSHLAIPSDYRALIVDVALSPHPLRATSRPGSLVHLHCSATGKLFLTHVYSEAIEVLAKTGAFERRTSNTKTTAQELRREIEHIRQVGYSVDDEEYNEDVRCLAVPVFGPDRSIVAAVGISAAKQRFPRTKIPSIYQTVRKTALAIEKGLGTRARDKSDVHI